MWHRHVATQLGVLRELGVKLFRNLLIPMGKGTPFEGCRKPLRRGYSDSDSGSGS